ncbi:MAG: alpha/beta fold hydrolase [Terrimonas sp.]|nr:alpha/beta fold hydrolase [Terrimonas sp.]
MKLTQRLAINYLKIKFRLLAILSKRQAAEKAFELFCTPQYRHKKNLPAKFLEAETLSTQFETYQLAGYRWNKGAPRKLLIIHGFESSVVNYEHLIDPLVKINYEVLAFDAPAHGRSSGSKIDLLIFKRFIQHIHEKFGPVDAFIAHSFGGLALSLALEEMKQEETNKVVLIAPLTESTTSMDLFFEYLGLGDPVRTRFMHIILERSGQPAAWYSIRRAIPALRAEVLWVHDEDDLLTPLSDALKVKEDQHENIRFVITRGLGHRRIYRDAEVRSKIISFLDPGIPTG